ncbi:MAG: CPBP family glutamic-type intramembrane protease [Candidatus Jordarchaeum sp.]|uniref:CPBP family glutamic-type intramembrane protease n=1 Tax=Candidatus Jordarchaeum sp. TaxID=2823881 RepID=UPI00404ABC1A
MTNLSPSIKIYIGLIITLAILAAVNVFLPQGVFLPVQELPVSRPGLSLVNACTALILYGGLGFIGLKLSKKLGFSDIWDSKFSNTQRFLNPALVGIATGVFFIFADAILSKFHTSGPLPHPPFPASLVASAAAGIGEELIFRLFFISFFVWLISYVILKKRWQNHIFWIVAVLSALAFALGHIPSGMILLGLNSVNEIPFALIAEIVLLNGVISLFAAYYFRKFEFLAPAGIHFWSDVVWHVIRGMI